MDESIERSFRVRTKGIITGRELVNDVYDHLAHARRFDQIEKFTIRLLERDGADVSEWLQWIDQERCENPQWKPFMIGGISTEKTEEFHGQMRDSFYQIASLVRDILRDHRPSEPPSESEGTANG